MYAGRMSNSSVRETFEVTVTLAHANCHLWLRRSDETGQRRELPPRRTKSLLSPGPKVAYLYSHHLTHVTLSTIHRTSLVGLHAPASIRWSSQTRAERTRARQSSTAGLRTGRTSVLLASPIPSIQDDAFTFVYACGRAAVLIHVADVGLCLCPPPDVFPRPRTARPLLPPLRAAYRHLAHIACVRTVLPADATAVRAVMYRHRLAARERAGRAGGGSGAERLRREPYVGLVAYLGSGSRAHPPRPC